jgi:hypothetical protein
MTSGAAVRGLVAGLVGTAAMTAAEKLEQAITGRPNSYVPRIRWSGCWGCRAGPTRSGWG